MQFESLLHGESKSIELPATSSKNDSKWKSPFQYFDHAYDFFGDGSFMLIDSHGHVQGHLVACVKLESGGSLMV